MSNKFYNLNYSPAAQGFDPGTWRKLFGTVTVTGNQLQFTQAAIIHYADILRGDATFNINIAAPLSDGITQFGFKQYNKNEYAYFQINGPTLTAESSDGITTSVSVPIPWQTGWTSTNTSFEIKWEAGAVRFFVGGNLMATIGCDSTLDIPVNVVPNDSMSLYLYSDSLDVFLLNYISVVGIQSYLMSTGNSNSVFEPFITKSDRITITDVPTFYWKNYIAGNGILSDNINVSDVNSMLMKILIANNGINVDNSQITESVTVSTPA